MKIGEKIEFYRKAANLSQEQLAKKIGLRKNTICSYETGSTSPRFDILEKIAQVCKIQLKDLILDNPLIISKEEYEELIKAIKTLEKIFK